MPVKYSFIGNSGEPLDTETIMSDTISIDTSEYDSKLIHAIYDAIVLAKSQMRKVKFIVINRDHYEALVKESSRIAHNLVFLEEFQDLSIVIAPVETPYCSGEPKDEYIYTYREDKKIDPTEELSSLEKRLYAAITS